MLGPYRQLLEEARRSEQTTGSLRDLRNQWDQQDRRLHSLANSAKAAGCGIPYEVEMHLAGGIRIR